MYIKKYTIFILLIIVIELLIYKYIYLTWIVFSTLSDDGGWAASISNRFVTSVVTVKWTVTLECILNASYSPWFTILLDTTTIKTDLLDIIGTIEHSSYIFLRVYLIGFFFLTHCKRRIIYPTSNWNLEGADLSEIFNSNKKQFLKSFGVWFFLGEVARSREPYEFPLNDFSWTHPGYKRRGIFNYISLSFFTLIT